MLPILQQYPPLKLFTINYHHQRQRIMPINLVLISHDPRKLILPPLTPTFNTPIKRSHRFISTSNLHLSIISLPRITLLIRTHRHYRQLWSSLLRGTISLINILPSGCSSHDIIDLFDFTHPSIKIFFIDCEFIGTSSTDETMAEFIFFGVSCGGELDSLDS